MSAALLVADSGPLIALARLDLLDGAFIVVDETGVRTHRRGEDFARLTSCYVL